MVGCFTYLGSNNLSSDGDAMSDITGRIEKAYRAFGSLRGPIFNNSNLSVATNLVATDKLELLKMGPLKEIPLKEIRLQSSGFGSAVIRLRNLGTESPTHQKAKHLQQSLCVSHIRNDQTPAMAGETNNTGTR